MRPLLRLLHVCLFSLTCRDNDQIRLELFRQWHKQVFPCVHVLRVADTDVVVLGCRKGDVAVETWGFFQITCQWSKDSKEHSVELQHEGAEGRALF